MDTGTPNLDHLREPMTRLAQEALDTVIGDQARLEEYKNAVAYHDSEKDKHIEALFSFGPLLVALGETPLIISHFGYNVAGQIAIQFVYNVCRKIANGLDRQEAIGAVFEGFAEETICDHWVYYCVANVQCLQQIEERIELADDVAVIPRSNEFLASTLGWGEYEINRFFEDAQHVWGGSSVLLIKSIAPKTPHTFALGSDNAWYPKAVRALLAMRIAAPGDISVGKFFTARPVRFRYSYGGLLSHGHSHMRPGREYKLDEGCLERIADIYKELTAFGELGVNSHRNLSLAFRSFGAMYERELGQQDDRLVDAITALEAVWKLDAELSFRLAFRTSMLLAQTDDERVVIYSTLKEYYNIRSKIVHGGGLKPEHEQKLQDIESLKEIVRRCLRGFLRMAVNPGDWTLAKLSKDTDAVLLHGETLGAVQRQMGFRR
jgi:hypothetical protein